MKSRVVWDKTFVSVDGKVYEAVLFVEHFEEFRTRSYFVTGVPGENILRTEEVVARSHDMGNWFCEEGSVPSLYGSGVQHRLYEMCKIKSLFPEKQ